MDTYNPPALTRELTIVNRRGLHARASAKFVKLVEGFDAEVNISKDGQTVGGTSIMGLMMLGAAMGDSITISCSGDGAEDGLALLVALVEDKFGEE